MHSFRFSPLICWTSRFRPHLCCWSRFLLLPTRGSAVVLTPSIFVLGSAPPGLAARYPAALSPRRDCSINLLESVLSVFVCIERGVLCHVFGQSKGGRVVMGVQKG